MKNLRLFAVLLTMLGCTQVHASDDDAPELFSRGEHYHVDYHINDDASAVITTSWALTILKEGAIAGLKSTSIGYSTSIEKAEVLEAYTRKADGRRIDSPRSNFQLEVNSGKGKDAPVFSDRTKLTVVFPDVAVGDTVVFAYRVTQSEPMFPRQFSIMDYFRKTLANDDVRISLDMPVALQIQYGVRGLTETRNTEKDGRKHLQWSYQNQQPLKNTRRDFSVYDPEADPGYSFSTFKSYAEIAEAYGARALPKAVVTARVQKLADELTVDQKTPREQARALYNWVAVNITYAGNCIGVGAVVPHDIDFILDNRMGDCKDHASLLQALLKAKGIDSTQALVNAGSGYRLPAIPVVSYVNHVINFVPSLDLYLDSTSSTTPFGRLPFTSSDKPTLLVQGFSEKTRTPAFEIGSNQQRVKTMLKINVDGSATGTMDVELKGLYATEIRAGMRDVPKDREAELVESVFRGMGLMGSGTYEKDDTSLLTDTFRYKVKFEIKNLIQRPGTGALSIFPPFLTPAPIAKYLLAANLPTEEFDVACGNGYTQEDYHIELPTGLKVLSLPDSIELKNDFVSYQASYRQKANTLTIKRVFDDRTRGNVCSPSVMSAYKAFATQVLPNFKSQLVYK